MFFFKKGEKKKKKKKKTRAYASSRPRGKRRFIFFWFFFCFLNLDPSIRMNIFHRALYCTQPERGELLTVCQMKVNCPPPNPNHPRRSPLEKLNEYPRNAHRAHLFSHPRCTSFKKKNVSLKRVYHSQRMSLSKSLKPSTSVASDGMPRASIADSPRRRRRHTTPHTHTPAHARATTHRVFVFKKTKKKNTRRIYAQTSSVREPEATVSLTCSRAHRSHATMSSRVGSRMSSFLCASMASSMVL